MSSATLESVNTDQYRLIGKIDFDQVPFLYQQGIVQFAKTHQSTIQIDLSQITSSNSAALALFLAWIRYAKRYNKHINYANMPPGLQQVAQICDIRSLLCNEN